MEVTPSYTYDTIARALAPHATGGTLPLNAAVRYATDAVLARFVSETAAADDRDREIEALRNEVGRLGTAYAAEIAALAAEAAQERLRAANAVLAAQDALRASAARTEALERVYVMAAARWDHEGGPELLRIALAECNVR